MLRRMVPRTLAAAALACETSSVAAQPTLLGTRRARRLPNRLLVGYVAVVMGGVPVAAGAQTLPHEAVQHLQYPRAEQLDSWPWRSGDVTVVIDQHGEYFLDGGTGDLRSVPRDSVGHVLERTLDDWDVTRFLFLVGDQRTDYATVRSLLETVYRAGIRVVAVIGGEQREPRIRTGMDLLLRTEADTLVGTQPERPQLPDSITTISRLFASPYAVVLNLPEDGSYRINGQSVSLANLADRLEETFSDPRPSAIFIDAAEHRPFQDVVTALDVARRAGVLTAVMWAASIERARAIRSGMTASDSLEGSRWAHLYSDAVVDVVPQRTSCPTPLYPAAMREAGIEGMVTLRFVVEPDGGVLPETITIVHASHQEFEAAARAMVVGCRFQPGTVRRHAVRVLVDMPVVFGLPKDPPNPAPQPGPG